MMTMMTDKDRDFWGLGNDTRNLGRLKGRFLSFLLFFLSLFPFSVVVIFDVG